MKYAKPSYSHQNKQIVLKDVPHLLNRPTGLILDHLQEKSSTKNDKSLKSVYTIK